MIMKINGTCYINKIGYDAYNATQWAINATSEGLPLEPFSQALWHFNRCTKGFERLIKSDQVVMDDNPITRWCFQNCTLKYDHNDNCKPIKEEKMQKIDGVIAMLQAIGIMIEEPHYQNSIFTI
jgi:phage terminase large subunit-like protein